MLPQNPLPLTQCEAKTWMLSIVREAWSTKTTIKQPWRKKLHRFLEVAKRNKWSEGSYFSSGSWKRETIMKKTVKSIKFNTKFCFTCTFSKKQDQPILFSSFFFRDLCLSLSVTSLSRLNTRQKKKKKKKRPKRERSRELTVTVLGCHKITN